MRWLRGLYLDLRSVALFRIALGLCVVADLLIRIPQIDAFYTDRGVMPREAIFGPLQGTWAVSLHFISGQWAVQLLLFLAALVFAVGMLLGYRTRLCTIGCWVLVMSLQVRSPLILHAGDDLLRMLLFWSMFVPLDGRYSLDRALNPSAPTAPSALLSPGSLALVFQICAVYWYTAAEKMHPIWLTERSAVYYALSLDQFATTFGKLLLQFPGFLQVMTSGTLVLEMLGPLLALSPVATGPLRLLAVALFLTFHAGLGLSLHLGLFPWVCAAAWLVFLPGMFWDLLGRRLGQWAVGTTVFFDAGCGFCRKAVLILREVLLLDGVELREAQSDAAIHEAMRQGNSWIVRDRGGATHSGYDAFVALSRVSPVGRPLAWLLGSAPARAIGERFYRWISSDRDRASRLLGRLTPPPPRLRFGVASSVVALLALVLVEATLARRPTLGLAALKPLEGKLIQLGQLGQSWRMFAPYPNTDDGWYVIEGITADGRRVDVWNGGGAPDYTKPADLWPRYRNSQWQKYLVNIWQRRNRGYRVYFGRYLCREWNEHHPELDRVDMVYVNYVLEMTPPPGASPPSATRESVFRSDCSENPSAPTASAR
jgi:predicted DCC family thiol-disulfide oxidoreductase YuxK